MREYPHLKDTAYPNLANENVWKYKNTFDYSRWDIGGKITLTSVRWDDAYKDVPLFDTIEKRDNYFSSLDSESFVLDTAYRIVRNEYIKLQVPYDVAIRYNYIIADMPISTSAAMPIDYENENGVRRYCYFIRDIEYNAPSTTSFLIEFDYWAMFSHEIRFNNAMVNRSHYAIANSSVNDYLSNPLLNNTYLLAQDVNYSSDASQVTKQNNIIFNKDNILCVIVSTSNPQGAFGEVHTNTWKTNGSNTIKDGALSFYAFGTDAANTAGILNNIKASVPQFMQTIKGVYFISSDYVNIGGAFNFCGIPCNTINQLRKSLDLIGLDKAAFGYNAKYANLAKLYTYPYAWLEVTSTDGETNFIRIEDTTGALKLETVSQLIYPWLCIDSHITGIGGGAYNVTFKNVSNHSLNIGGNWAQVLKRFAIPAYQVVLDAATVNDYATHFDRQQQALQNQTNLSNASDSALTTKNNADAAANTAKSNNDTQIAANNTILTRTQQSEQTLLDDRQTSRVEVTNRQNATLEYMKNCDNATSRKLAQVSNEQTTALTNANNQAAIANTAVDAVGGVASGAIQGGVTGGPAGAAVGAVTGLVGQVGNIAHTAISVNAANAACTIAVSTNNDVVDATTENNSNKTTRVQTDNGLMNLLTTAYEEVSLDHMQAAARDNTNTSNNASNTIATRNRDTSLANNQRNYNTAIGIANRNKSTADEGIRNQIRQAGLAAPSEFGSLSDGETAATRPQGFSVLVKTQSESAIKQTGDYFLRYGYAVNSHIDIESVSELCPMPKFCYWEMNDLYIENQNDFNNEIEETIRNIFINGVTVWKDANDIGRISIYEN